MYLLIPVLKKEEKSHINNLTFHFRKLEKEDQSKCQASRKKEIVKFRMEIVVTVCYLSESEPIRGDNHLHRQCVKALVVYF